MILNVTAVSINTGRGIINSLSAQIDWHVWPAFGYSVYLPWTSFAWRIEVICVTCYLNGDGCARNGKITASTWPKEHLILLQSQNSLVRHKKMFLIKMEHILITTGSCKNGLTAQVSRYSDMMPNRPCSCNMVNKTFFNQKIGYYFFKLVCFNKGLV